MDIQQTTNRETGIYTPEQKELWDKTLNGPGYYQAVGEQAYTFLTHRVGQMVSNDADPKTVLVIGDAFKCESFFERMTEREVIDGVVFHQPRFFRFEDRSTSDNSEYIYKTLESEMDAEQFRNFIATSVDKEYYPVCAVVVFDDGFTNGKPYQHLDKVLEVPVWKNGRLVKTIRPVVLNVCDGDCGDDSLNFCKESSEAASIDWRKDTYSITELPDTKEKWLLEHLIPEKALTIIAAPSYTGKTHIAIEMGLAMATGTALLDHFKGPAQPVPVIYHVPELHASLFRSFVGRLSADERLKGQEEMFLIRPLEFDLWQLDSPQMIDSSRGRYVFLDTVGYFNDADDSASYTQAITFAKKINTLIREGCLGVCALYHPPKYSKNKKETGNVMTLENQILGSAGYGGVLRSCLGMRNLHEDSNKGLWVYVQGLKNPGLEGPFQIEGMPLRLVKKPGESLYLSELLKDNGGRREQALAMAKEGKSRDEICKALKLSPKTFTKFKQESEFDSDDEG
jgi:AAA domain